jgi:hypothetical protein
MAPKKTPIAAFDHFRDLSAELQVAIIKRAWEEVLASRANIVTLRFSPSGVRVTPNPFLNFVQVNRLFRYEIHRLAGYGEADTAVKQHIPTSSR